MNTLSGAVQLTAEQDAAIDFVLQNLKYGVVALAGPAGSGKTTVIKELAARLTDRKLPVTITATTNKAAVVLRRKGIPAITFHQACMRPKFRPPMDKLGGFLEQAFAENPEKAAYPECLIGKFTKDVLKEALDITKASGVYAGFRHLGIKDAFKYIDSWLPAPQSVGVLIIDEASMLGEIELENARDVYSRIVLVGDEFQLPPVKSQPVFWQIKERVALTQVHRQAAGSQPLQIANAIRNGERVRMDWDSIDLELCKQGTPVIVWRNSTRTQLIKDIRKKLGYDGLGPQPGEVLICRNSADRAAKNKGLINNSLWTVLESNGTVCTIQDDDGNVLEGEDIHIEELEMGLGVPFRFGYAITCHVSQGSEWDCVQIHTPDAQAYLRFKPNECKHWLYTACTRAKAQVRWVSSRIA